MATPVEDLKSDIRACMAVGSVAGLAGPPGCGKTALVGSLAREMGGAFVTIIGSQCEASDINGFPVVVDNEKEVDAVGRKHPVLQFAPRAGFVELRRLGGILFFDEATCAPNSVQAAMLRGLCEWVFGDYALDRSKVGIVVAYNPADIAVNGTELGDPFNNRIAHFEFPVDEEARVEWCDQFPNYWGTPPKVGFNEKFLSTDALLRARSAVAGYIRRNPKHWLDERFSKLSETDTKKKRKSGTDDRTSPAWPSPRSWERVANHLAHAVDNGRSPLSAARRIQAEIGIPAIEFLTYLKEASLPDPETLLADPDRYKSSDRLDVDFATTMAVVSAFETKITGPRYLACWKICAKSVAHRGEGGPAYEAGMAAALKLVKYFKGEKSKSLIDTMTKDEWMKLAPETNRLSKPFLGLIKQAAGELLA